MRVGQWRAPGAPASVDAVLIDGYGTLLTLRDPTGHLDRELRARGVELAPAEIERGFEAEVDYYMGAKLAAADADALATLRTSCAQVFLDAAGVPLDAGEFAPAFAFEFDPLPGAAQALARLSAHGFALAVVADWDFSLHDHLAISGLASHFGAVVTSAEFGAAKPDPAPFVAALDRLAVEPRRALHIGDHRSDEEGAAAAGVRFLPAPLAEVVDAWLA